MAKHCHVSVRRRWVNDEVVGLDFIPSEDPFIELPIVTERAEIVALQQLVDILF